MVISIIKVLKISNRQTAKVLRKTPLFYQIIMAKLDNTYSSSSRLILIILLTLWQMAYQTIKLWVKISMLIVEISSRMHKEILKHNLLRYYLPTFKVVKVFSLAKHHH
jgi:hypothetical protein